jgi:multidrug efflux system membrane fusion protein
VGILMVLLSGMAALSACSDKASGKATVTSAVPVSVGEVVQKAVPLQLRAIGNVQAYSTVSIKSQVEGTLARVYFKEGQDVKKGDLIFLIDPRSFEAALRQAEANLARDTAQAANAKIDERRFADLYKEGGVSQQQYDQARTSATALEATLQWDRSAVENAKLQLGYASIRSPINGRTGNLLVHEGNLIKANDADHPLVVINQVRPIYVSFSVPEQELPAIRRYMASGNLKVEAITLGREGRQPLGDLTFVDNAVDRTTGTVELKATFTNADNALWPGQFVNVVLTLTTEPNALVVPSQAIQTGQQGPYVFVVKPDLTVESRPIVVHRTIERETVIEKGLASGERVVTDGQVRLVPGAKVEIKPLNPAPTPNAG